ncbi:hypothetical protein GmHk_14G041767 [Glycine max]|nr:hypothetical protein GmHk_14G041767 [Glycine max]
MTISQYYGWASINQQQLAEIIGSLKEDRRNEIIGNLKEEVRNEIEEENKRSLEKMKHELKDAIKIEFSQRGSQYSPLIEANIHVLGARVSTKGSNAETAVNPSGEEHDGYVIPTMGLYMKRDNCTHLMALEKIYEGGEDSHISPKKLAKPVQRLNNVAADDPLHHLIKSLYDIYEKPIELMWDGTKFGIPNIDASFFLTYSDVNEIISGLWMTGAQVWVMVRCIDSLSLSRYTMAHWQLVVLCPRNDVVV